VLTPELFALRSPHQVAAPDVLKQLGLRKLRKRDSAELELNLVAVHDDGHWLQVASMWSLYDIKGRAAKIRRASRHGTAIYFCVGDCDQSYEFAVFEDGRLRRDFSVASPGYDDHVVERNSGGPLPGESRCIDASSGDMIPEDPERYPEQLYKLFAPFDLRPPPMNARLSYYQHAPR
jgi:hypothetical protein